MISVYVQRSQKRKKTDCLSVLFALLGTECVNAARKTLMNLSPGVNFINILQVAFMSTDSKSANKTDNLTDFFTLLGFARVNAAPKTLMKLNPGLVKLFKNPFYPTDVRQKQACHSFELRNNRYKVNHIKLKNCKFTKKPNISIKNLAITEKYVCVSHPQAHHSKIAKGVFFKFYRIMSC